MHILRDQIFMEIEARTQGNSELNMLSVMAHVHNSGWLHNHYYATVSCITVFHSPPVCYLLIISSQGCLHLVIVIAGPHIVSRLEQFDRSMLILAMLVLT